MNTVFLVFIIVVFVSSIFCDEKCISQKAVIDKSFQIKNPINSMKFTDTPEASVMVSWIGENTGKLILIFHEVIMIAFRPIVTNSSVFLSKDNGKNFTNITSKLPVDKLIVQLNNGLQRNFNNPNHIFILSLMPNGYTNLLITKDGAKTWFKTELPFILNGLIESNPLNSDSLLAISHKHNLYISTDAGKSWTKIAEMVASAKWTNNPKNSREIIISQQRSIMTVEELLQNFMQSHFLVRQPKYTLLKTSNNGAVWKIIRRNVYGFMIKDKYFYLSEQRSGNRRRMLVSVDYGETFKFVYLPTIMNNQFYAILDIDDDMVFIHVDSNKNNGSGTIFTSDKDGQVFSQSLANHFMPSGTNTDFYKVQSMRGTYITSQLLADNSIRTLITFNKGAEWTTLRPPNNEPCHKDDPMNCTLQISNVFSKSQQVNTEAPLSTPTAIGLILVHGHLATKLKTSAPDVFISSDGGYNWNKTLSGPHMYQIADHGGLLVAISTSHMTSEQQILKFSTDEGRCWHQHKFTNDLINIKGIITEPGNKAMTVALWGYHYATKIWNIYVVDLSELLNKECTSSDYDDWLAHSEMLHPNGKQYAGCLLGKKETFQRLKPDSLCRNGFSHKVQKEEAICPCTEDDFECEYGYFRPVNSKTCIRNNLISESLCINGTVETIITQGYKKIAGDVCSKGFAPDKTKQKMINKTCNIEKPSQHQTTVSTKNPKDIKTERSTVSNTTTVKPTSTSSKPINKQAYTIGGFIFTNKSLTVPPSEISHNVNYITSAIFNKQIQSGETSPRGPVASSHVVLIIICVIVITLALTMLVFVFMQRSRNVRQHRSNIQYKIMAGLRSFTNNSSAQHSTNIGGLDDNSSINAPNVEDDAPLLINGDFEGTYGHPPPTYYNSTNNNSAAAANEDSANPDDVLIMPPKRQPITKHQQKSNRNQDEDLIKDLDSNSSDVEILG